MVSIILWWLGLAFFSWAAFPLVRRVLVRFPDLGYPFAKTLGLIGVSYLTWLGGLGHFLPFTRVGILGLGLGLGILTRALFPSPPSFRHPQRQLIITQEILFIVVFLSLLFIRAHQPDIRGLEKFMDYGFVQSIVKTRFFPPPDMWFAGKTINYYYFGHLSAATLIKLTAVPPEFGYNFMLATIAGIAFTSTASLAAYLTGWLTPRRRFPLGWGLISAALVTFGGNQQLLYHLFTQGSLRDYWYPDATRFIVEKFGAADNTIHEFPGYSFIVADLHGHLNGLPLVLFALALALGLMFRKSTWKKELFSLVLFGFIMGTAFMTNAWDLPIYYLFFGLLLLARSWPFRLSLRWFGQIARLLLSALFVSLITILPFLATFENIAQGIVSVDFHSPPWMLGYLWGLPLVVTIVYFWFWPQLPKNKRLYFTALLIGGWLLILLPEIIRIKDIYHFKHQRANTMFKLTYQAFIVFHLLVGPILSRLVSLKRLAAWPVLILIFAATAVSLSYPYFGFTSYYFSPPRHPPTLNGMDFLARAYPDDYQAVLWLRANTSGQPVVLEAVGESYSDFARVSTFTGLPTVVGWPVHEWLWRSDSVQPYQRQSEVALMFTEPEGKTAQALFASYRVTYVFVGHLERLAYPKLNKTFFEENATAVFRQGETTVYKLENFLDTEVQT